MKKYFFLIAVLCLFGCRRALCDGETIDEKQLLAAINGRAANEQQTLYYEVSLDRKSALAKLSLEADEVAAIALYESMLVQDPSFIAVITWKKESERESLAKHINVYCQKVQEEKKITLKGKVYACGSQDVVIVAPDCGKIKKAIEAYDS